ncbi:MAG TPA: pilus assembly protein N-terminal domain-containing protein [Longimicrobiaceae bacterium]|nr:pilus assembly protein N-terminal domain-containing protein [Longimicrobiaceae bacterium]
MRFPTVAGPVRSRQVVRPVRVLTLVLLALFCRWEPAAAQTVQEDVIIVPKGQSVLVTSPAPVARVSIGDPGVADATAVSPREVLVNAKALGTTTLIIWDVNGARRTTSIEVTVNAAALERQFRTLFPGEPITVAATGGTVVVSGTARSPRSAALALQLARATGATVVDNLVSPASQQVLLQVRFAEVSRNALDELRTSIAVANPDRIRGVDQSAVQTISSELFRLMLFGSDVALDATIEAQRTRGEFRSLAEPNLLALDGAEASFLAGGEFPYPVVQGGDANTTRVTVVFKEFGVRLNFLPQVTGAGNVRLRVAPEVSSLDFSNALRISGFLIPSLLTRRASTEVELRDGETFAIAGLMNNTFLNNRGRVPWLGDIPILGALFQSRERRETRTELLVLVTPRLVRPSAEAPPVPTGEPDTWNWSPPMRPEAARP